MSVILACERYRARSFGLLVQIRRIAAYALARGVRLSFRWHPSELNSSDAGSRIYDPNYDASKDLTRRVAGSCGPDDVLPQHADLPHTVDVVAQDAPSPTPRLTPLSSLYHDCNEVDVTSPSLVEPELADADSDYHTACSDHLADLGGPPGLSLPSSGTAHGGFSSSSRSARPACASTRPSASCRGWATGASGPPVSRATVSTSRRPPP